MSVRVMSEVWRLDLPPNEKFVLLALADHADDDGSKVFPSVALIAWKTGFTERGVQKVMRRLASDGLIVAVKESKGRKTTVYRIETGAGKLKATLNPVHPSTPANPEPGSPLPRTPFRVNPEPGSPDPSYNHQLNHQRVVAASPATTHDALIALWCEEYRQHRRRDYAITKRRGKGKGNDFEAAKELLEKGTPAEILSVAKAAWSKKGKTFFLCKTQAGTLSGLNSEWNRIRDELDMAPGKVPSEATASVNGDITHQL